MDDKGFPKRSNIQAPPFLSQYEEYRDRGESLYLDSSQFIDLVYYYHSEKEHNNALQAIEDGFKFHPNNNRLLLEKGYILIEMGFLEDAIEAVDLVAESSEDELEIILIRAELLLMQNKVEEAADLLAQIDIEKSNDLTTVLDVVFLYLDFNQFTTALLLLKSVESKFKNDVNYLGAYADCFFGLEEFDKAIKVYDQLLDIEPYNGRHWFGIARCYFEKEEYTKCLEASDYGLVTDFNHGDFYLIKANSYFQLNLNSEAIVYYKKAIEYKAEDIDIIHILLGASYEESKDWENAIKHYRIAMDMVTLKDTNSQLLPDIYNNLALMLAKIGKYEEANELAQLAFFKNKNPEYLFTQAEVAILEKNFKEAKSILDSLEQVTDKEVDIYRIVSLYYATQSLVRPKKILRQLEEDNILSRDYKIDLACLSLLLGHTKELATRNKEVQFKVETDSLDQLYLYLLSKNKKELAILIKEFKTKNNL